jgi:DHA1 family bicyclomycin/chloramphenicol resistance-like MFS transporter
MKKIEASNRTIIWILGALSTVTPFAIDMYLPAFALIAADFGTTAATISLSVSSYFIGMAIGQILYGPLLDRYGRKRPLYVGLIIFIVASLACTQTHSITSLVTYRFFQALGGSVAWVGAVSMVRDFFPVKESARVFSLLILILGVSPLLAPTFGGFIVTAFGWQSIFIILAAIVVIVFVIVYFFLPEGHEPDPTISLKAGPMLETFFGILKNPQFYTYAFAGSFSFATLFIYVAGSPIIFMEIHQVSPKVYGGIFALLSVGFIGSSQVNILLTRTYVSDKIFKIALICQVVAGFIFVVGLASDSLGLYGTIIMFFISLCCIGLINPNANALALAPFTRTIGSASALMGCSQIGIAALSSFGVGLFNTNDALPIVILMTTTSSIALVIFIAGQRRIGKELVISEATVETLAH